MQPTPFALPSAGPWCLSRVVPAWLAVTAGLVLYAESAAVGDEVIRLPDGTTEVLTYVRDYGFVFFRDESGYSLMKVKDHFEYAVINRELGHLVPSGHIKGQVDPKTVGIPPGIRFSSRRVRGIGADNEAGGPKPQWPEGEFNVLIVPMRFSNHRDRELPDQETLHRIFSRRGGDPEYAPAGSVRDYMQRVSYGQFTPNFHILPWVDLPRSEQYYAEFEPVKAIAQGYRVDEACFYALGAADTDFPDLDLSQFDRNRDGYIDAVGFLHSGYGSEARGIDPDGVPFESRLDSMQYEIPEWTSRTGMKVRRVAVVSALFGHRGGRPVRVGVLSHEAGHMFGLPDLYNTRTHFVSGTVGSGIGVWGVLGDSWGVDRSQNFPLHMTPWSKTMLRWVNPRVIDRPGEYSIRAVEKFPEIYRINQGFPPGEYLLIENRQPTGFDAQIPSGADGQRGGLAIWHIDDRKTSANDPGHPGQPGFPENNSHLRVALLQADGRFDLEQGRNKGDGDDLFRAGGVHEIGPDTTPNTNAYQLGIVRRTGIRISRISESAERMTFRVDFLPTGGSGQRSQTSTEQRPEPRPAATGPHNTTPQSGLVAAPDTTPVAGGTTQPVPVAQPERPQPRPARPPQPEPVQPEPATPTQPATPIASAHGHEHGAQTERQPEPASEAQPESGPQIIREVQLTLSRPAVVSVTGTAVLRATVARQTAMVALARDKAIWRTSSRFTTLARADQVVPVSTRIVREFEAGTHTLRLVLDTPEGRIDTEPESSLTFFVVGADPSDGSLLSSEAPVVAGSPERRSPFLASGDGGPERTPQPAIAQSRRRIPTDVAWSDLGGRDPIGFNQPDRVGSLTLELAEPADVVFSANMSFASPAERNAFVIGLTNSDDPAAQAWPDSQRTDATTFADQCVTSGSRCVRRLSAGTHTVHWRIEPQGNSPTFAIGGGILTAEVFPVSTLPADRRE